MPPQQKKPVNWRAWILGALVALVLVVALQNSQEVSFEVLSASFNAPLIVVLLIAVGIGALIGYAAPVLLRHRREQRRQQGERDGRRPPASLRLNRSAKTGGHRPKISAEGIPITSPWNRLRVP